MNNKKGYYSRIIKIESDLQQRGLILDSKYNFTDIIGRYGYENTIQKYQMKFLKDSSDNESKFISGTKISDIIGLFYFDIDLRKEVLSIMQLFELQFKEAMINIISCEISPNYDEYSKPKYFRENYPFKGEAGKSYEETTRRWLKRRFKNYNKKAGIKLIALKMISKMYFHEIEDWYFLLSDNLKRKVAYYIEMGPLFEEINQSKDNDPTLVIDPMLRLYCGFRNQAAHEGVIYNYYDPKISWPYVKAYFMSREIITEDNHCSIGLLLLHSYFFPDRKLFHRFDNAIYSVVKNYISKFPNQVSIIKDMKLDNFQGIDDRFDELINNN